MPATCDRLVARMETVYRDSCQGCRGRRHRSPPRSESSCEEMYLFYSHYANSLVANLSRRMTAATLVSSLGEDVNTKVGHY